MERFTDTVNLGTSVPEAMSWRQMYLSFPAARVQASLAESFTFVKFLLPAAFAAVVRSIARCLPRDVLPSVDTAGLLCVLNFPEFHLAI